MCSCVIGMFFNYKLAWLLLHTDSGAALAVTSAHFGEGNGPIFLDQVQCIGNEENLLDCERGAVLGEHMCDHSEDVGIRCQGT